MTALEGTASKRLHRGMVIWLKDREGTAVRKRVIYGSGFSPGIFWNSWGNREVGLLYLYPGGKTYQTPEMPEKESGRAYP